MPWYAWEPRNGLMWPPPPRDEGEDQIRVPRNVAEFRRFRDVKRAEAATAMTMALGMWSFPGVLIYAVLVDPYPKSLVLEIAGFLTPALLVLVLGVVAWPILQQAQDVTQVLKQNLPALIVSQIGIWDYSSSYVFGFIPWEDIEAVMVDSRYSPRVEKQWIGVGVVAKNKEVLLRRKPLTRLWLNVEPTIAFRRQIFIPQEWIDIPAEELVKQIEEFRLAGEQGKKTSARIRDRSEERL